MTASRQGGQANVGASHPEVLRYRATKRHPAQGSGRVAIEGTWFVERAERARLALDVVFVCPSLLRGGESSALVARLRAGGTAVVEVSERAFQRMVDRDGPDGVAAIVELPIATLDDIALGPESTVVVADRFELPGNLGTLIRCADASGAAAVIVCDRSTSVHHPAVIRASMGTAFTMATVTAEHAALVAWLRLHGFRIVAADPAAPTSYRHALFGGRVALVLGAERTGLSSDWLRIADQLISIPMRGVADSLNVAVAGAVLLYEVLHQRELR